MPEKEFRAEKMYLVSRSVAEAMLKQGIISASDCAKIEARLLAKFRPTISSLVAGKRLT